MPLSVVWFLLAVVAAFASLVCIWVKAFRVSVVWGLVTVFVPFGFLAFTIKHWGEAGKFFILYLLCAGASGPLFFNSPPLVAAVTRAVPQFADVAKQINPRAYAESQTLPGGSNQPDASPTPREVRDLAENEVPGAAAAPPDPNAVQRAAYAKHLKDLTAVYQQLNAERPKLKPGSPAVAAFNARLARYQQDLASVTEEKARLDTLDHSSNANAAAALASLQISAQTGDYEAFAATLKKSLSDYRQTPVFPQIVALARTTLQQATPDKVLAGFQNKATGAVRAEFDKTTRQVQAIVNQAPPVVAPPTGHKEVYHYAYHPGANKPDYNADNLIATREIWKGDYAYLEDVPGVFYRSADCEFNPQTKFFYLSRTVAKKKLSDAEYQELTRLYHLLGQQEKAMTDAPAATKDAERVSGDLAALKTQLDGYATK